MELFLNLAWLLLALPACWLWQSARNVRGRRRFSSLQCLLALASVLVLLFPVISATDDLLAMRTEIEESAPGKRAVGQGATDRCSISNSRFQGPALLVAAAPIFTLVNNRRVAPHQVLPSPRLAYSTLPPSRAPPTFRLG
jgi:hypothetical protein